MIKKTFLLSFILSLCVIFLKGQDVAVHPAYINTGTFLGVSKPLRDLPVMTKKDWRAMARYAEKHELNEGLGHRSYPFAATALPKGEDPLWQKYMGKVKGSNGPLVNFEGQSSPYYPPDCNGTPGPNHFMQTINTVFAIYDKTGTLVAGPTNLNLLFGSVPGANRNDGDPIILYDKVADRWLVTEFSLGGGQNYMMMAVSTTNDPTGTWYQYSFPVATMPDYPKFGVWRDGYYMGDNNNPGKDIYVMERTPMLSGGTAQVIGFDNPNRPSSVDGFMCVPPVNNDGMFAPTGSPAYYIAFNDDALGGGSDQLWLYELSVNWTTPTSSTFARTQQLDVEAFNSSFGNNWNNIEQSGTSQRLDGIPQVIMNVPQYRNFGSYQTIVCCHTVNLDGAHHAGIRWYELRKTTGDWSIRQQGTYAPDADSRWMGSIMLNGHNKIGLGYSVSSTTLHPGIRFCGQSTAAYNQGNGIMDIKEDTIQTGAYSQAGQNRWGDYSLLSVDPVDDETFWFTSEFIGSGGSRKTKIASFKFNIGPAVATLAATSITGVSATLNGTVNPNGTETFYRFAYGTNPLSLADSTASISAGSGSDTLPVSAAISNLLPNTKYYFKIFATSLAGNASGAGKNFTTGGAPVLSVTPPNRDVAIAAGNTEFYVTPNTDWTVVSDAAWCTVTPSGINNDTITAIFTENTLVGVRIAHITVSGTGAGSQVVTVSQAGIPAILSVTPPNRDVLIQPGSTRFFVASNTDWTVVSNSSWCTVPAAGSGNDSITAVFEANPLFETRIASVTVTVAGLASQTVTVTQEGIPYILSVTPPNQNVNYAPGNTSFSVTSNASWDAVSDAPWCTVTPSGSGDGTIVADFTENSGSQARTANILVSLSAPGTLTQTVTVSQTKPNIGIGENDLEGVKIYPNPSKGVFRIVPPAGAAESIEVTVEEISGKILLTKTCRGEKEYLVDLSQSPQGTYNIILKTSSTTLVRKLVILK
ncbi:MAG: BACON domain-containing carbohydrate-binding protein [Bacteroidetes bacterium]|nr:BACON domain-containing carbohydrate-binding protein [Bacteroidota bacterium]